MWQHLETQPGAKREPKHNEHGGESRLFHKEIVVVSVWQPALGGSAHGRKTLQGCPSGLYRSIGKDNALQG